MMNLIARFIPLAVAMCGLGACTSIDFSQVRQGLVGKNVDIVTARLGDPVEVNQLGHSRSRVFVYRAIDPGQPCSPEVEKFLGDLFCDVAETPSSCEMRVLVSSRGSVSDVSLRNPRHAGGPACQVAFQALGFTPAP